jgi:hypothetical protein
VGAPLSQSIKKKEREGVNQKGYKLNSHGPTGYLKTFKQKMQGGGGSTIKFYLSEFKSKLNYRMARANKIL